MQEGCDSVFIVDATLWKALSRLVLVKFLMAGELAIVYNFLFVLKTEYF